MIEKINKWLPSVTFVCLVVLTLVLVGGNNQSASSVVGRIGSEFPNGLSVGPGLTISTPGEFISGVKTTLTGTTTVSQSPDGFVLYSAITMSTTTPATAQAVVTNSGTDLICNGSSLTIYNYASGQFAPPYKYVVGTSTTATGYSANIMASTTIATTTVAGTIQVQGIKTNGVIPWNFNLPGGSSITLTMADGASTASSTGLSLNAGQMSVQCWTTGQ